MGFGFATVTPSATSVAQAGAAAVWTYPQRSLTDIQSLTAAIQNNDPSAVPSYSDLQYVPVPYYASQVTADQVAAFIDNAIRNYNLLNPFVGFINNNPYNLWPPNAVGAFLSSQNMPQTSVALLLMYAGATQMAQALSNLSGNYTNVVNAFNVVSPSTAATVMANVSASQAVTLLSHPVMSVTQAAMILSNSAMPVAQGVSILNIMAVGTAVIILSNPNMPVAQAATYLSNSNMSLTQAALILSNANMSVTQAASIVSVSVNYNMTQVAQELNLLSTSELVNIAMNSNMSLTSLAAILGNAGLSANNAQLVLYYMAQNYYYNRWVNTIMANAGATTIATNVTVVNPLYSQNLTVASGVTVTCGTTTCFFVAQSFNNYGTVVSPYGAVGGTSTEGGGPGGTGGGGIIIIAYTAAIGTVNVNGNAGGTAWYTTVSGTSYNGVGGVFAVMTGMSVPIGGTGGGSYPGTPGYNGGGGGWGNLATYGAAGGSATLNSFTNGNALITYIMQGLSDWWLSNLYGKTPSTVTKLLYIYGSGGGAGAVGSSGYYGGGGGGGGGGEAIIYGYNVIAGTIDAAGGAGGVTGTTYDSEENSGGGGGGGGVVLVFYGSGGLNGTMTYNVAGGVGGSGYYSGTAGGTGSYLATSVTVNG